MPENQQVLEHSSYPQGQSSWCHAQYGCRGWSRQHTISMKNHLSLVKEVLVVAVDLMHDRSSWIGIGGEESGFPQATVITNRKGWITTRGKQVSPLRIINYERCIPFLSFVIQLCWECTFHDSISELNSSNRISVGRLPHYFCPRTSNLEANGKLRVLLSWTMNEASMNLYSRNYYSFFEKFYNRILVFETPIPLENALPVHPVNTPHRISSFSCR